MLKLILFFSIILNPLYAENRRAVGNVSTVTGEVTIDGQAAVEGVEVFSGQTIESENGKTKVLFFDDTVLDVGEFTSIVVEKYDIDPARNVALELKKGKVRTAIHEKLRREGKFQIKTRSSVLAVRGTEFLTLVEVIGEEVREQYTVSDGELSSQSRLDPSAASVILRPGNQYHTYASVQNGRLTSEPSKASNGGQVVSIPATEVQSLMSTNTVESKSLDKISDVKSGNAKLFKNKKGPPLPKAKPGPTGQKFFKYFKPDTKDPEGLEGGDRAQFSVELTVKFVPQ